MTTCRTTSSKDILHLDSCKVGSLIPEKTGTRSGGRRRTGGPNATSSSETKPEDPFLSQGVRPGDTKASGTPVGPEKGRDTEVHLFHVNDELTPSNRIAGEVRTGSWCTTSMDGVVPPGHLLGPPSPGKGTKGW